MNIAEWSIKNKTICLVAVFIMFIGGIKSYGDLGRLEDPEFTIKEALITTQYPGASPREVEEEVTEVIETAIQELGQLKEITSISKPGESIITVKIKDKYDNVTLPQVWDELRRKVNDAQQRLPPGVQPSIVFDDYGDVYGVLIALQGEDYSYAELKDIADFLRRELLLVEDVAKIVLWGVQQEQIFVEISRSKTAQLGLSLDAIYETLKKQNLVVDAGSVRVGNEFIRINPSGEIDSVDEIENLLIRGGKGGQSYIYLKDIAEVKRGYITPPKTLLRYNGEKAIALGISTIQGGNVVTMGHGLVEKLKYLLPQIPLGISANAIYYQAEGVEKSVNSFLVNLLQALAIVVGVLMIFMGLRSGLLIGAILLITVLTTFVFMNIYAISLERISLGALIIALGMLVDNAIVVTDGYLIRVQQGMEKIKAANEAVIRTMWPLFGATVVAVLAFAAIGLSDDSTGEYLRSLFQVILISLGMSWVIAVTITPLFCVLFLKPSENTNSTDDPYKGALFVMYKNFLVLCLQFRWMAVGVVVALLLSAVHAFGYLEDSFFPDSSSPIILAHYWLPEGTDIRKTSADTVEIEKFILKQEGVESVSTFVGAGAPRFMLVYSPEKSYDGYALLMVTVDDYKRNDALMKTIKDHLKNKYVNSNPKLEKIRLGPGGGFAIEARFSGQSPTKLRELSEKAKKIMRDDGGVAGIRDDWRERVKIVRPIFSESQARRAGVNRDDLAEALQTAFIGTPVGIYRERDELLPILSRKPEEERSNVDHIKDVHIWSHTAQSAIPIRQVVSRFDTTWEDAVRHRREKRRTITMQSDQKSGNASVVFNRIRDKIESIPLPPGYEFEWGGEYEDSIDAQKGLTKNLPVTVLMMIFVVITLFNALRQPLIVWLTIPLSIIGVTYGLLLTGESFGFMAMLGFLSLSGMLIKNAIVLIDEIDLQIKEGKERHHAIIEASVSRMRPVSMAAITTVLGMIPLLTDVFFKGMAVTIMAGLSFATLLTLIIVPVFYAIFFNIKEEVKQIT